MGDGGYRMGAERRRDSDNDGALGLSLRGIQEDDLEGWLDVLCSLPETSEGLSVSEQGGTGAEDCRVATHNHGEVCSLPGAISDLCLRAPATRRAAGGWLGDAPVAISPNIVATPTPVPDLPPPEIPTVEVDNHAEPAASVGSDIVGEFIQGYRDFGGDPSWEGTVLAMVECESTWRVDPPGPHLGLAQFAFSTWLLAARPGADYRDPYEQGWAVASWMAQIPGRWGTSAGWPNCWN